MPSLQAIQTALAMLVVHYGANKDQDEMEVLKATWSDDLQDISDAEFVQAVREMRKRSRFFFTSADVLSVVYEQRMSAGTPEHRAIEARTSEEQIALNQRWVKKINEQLSGAFRS